MKSVIICDMEGVIQNLNKGAEEMFGYSNLELVGKKEFLFFLLEKLFYKMFLDG